MLVEFQQQLRLGHRLRPFNLQQEHHGLMDVAESCWWGPRELQRCHLLRKYQTVLREHLGLIKEILEVVEALGG
jgi:hypothetical protein